MKTYIVRKPFKSMGVFYEVGSIVTDPTNIKRVKSKVSEGKLVPLNKDNESEVVEYFKSKFMMDISSKVKDALSPKSNKDVKKKATPKAKAKTKAKPAVKVSVK